MHFADYLEVDFESLLDYEVPTVALGRFFWKLELGT